MRCLLLYVLVALTWGVAAADTNLDCADSPTMLSRLEAEGMRQRIYGTEIGTGTEDSHVLVWFREESKTDTLTFITRTKTLFKITKTTGDITCIIADGENWVSF